MASPVKKDIRFRADLAALAAEARAVAAAAGRHASLPALSHVRLAISASGIDLACTDLVVDLHGRVDGDGVGGGLAAGPVTMSVKARLFSDILARAEGTEVELEVERGTAAEGGEPSALTLRAGKATWRLLCLPASAFPDLAPVDPEGGVTVTVEEGHLRELLIGGAYVDLDYRSQFSPDSILLELRGRVARAVSTDGKRMAVADEPFAPSAPEAKRSALIPDRVVAAFLRMRTEGDGPSPAPASVTVGPAVVAFRLRRRLLVARATKADGFPDYEKVLALPRDRGFRVDRTALAEVVARAATMTTDRNRAVVLGVGGDRLTIRGSNHDLGVAVDELEVEAIGAGAVSLGINVVYLAEAIAAAAPAERVTVWLRDRQSPVTVEACRPDGPDDAPPLERRTIIMPTML